MMLLGNQKINDKNHLTIGGCDVVDLAAQFGTPLYVMDEAYMRGKCREYKKTFAENYENSAIAYASKAFCVTAMCALVAQEGLWIDVSSAGELHTAVKAGFPMERVVFHGNYKTGEELEMAIQHRVKYVVADSFLEIEQLDHIAGEAGLKQDVILRCNPGVDPHTHRLISTGQEDSKFGFNIKNGLAMKAARAVMESPNLALKGLHCHLGSQLFDFTPFEEAAPVMVGFMKQVLDQTGITLEVLDMGGGPGVRYLEEHDPPSVADFAYTVATSVIRALEAEGLAKPLLIVEPGRSIPGEAGTTIYTIGPVKTVAIPEQPGERTYISIDGGLSDNPRPALYDALYSAMVANKAGNEPTKTYTVSGRHCETDMLIPSVKLSEAKTGDLLAVQTTGAYNYAMASNYNRFTRPAVVFVMDGKADVVVRRETLDDVLKCDLLPDRFNV